jgi:hypothetical protein
MVTLLSTKESSSYKHRELILKKFNVMVLEPKSALKLLKEVERKAQAKDKKMQKELEEKLCE